MTWKLITSILLVPVYFGSFAAAGTVAFKPAQNYPVGTNPTAITVGDFNSDGNLDLAVVNLGDPTVNDNGGVSVLLGNGDGTFKTTIDVVAGKNPSALAIGDFNGDHKVDLAVINADLGGALGILLGNGDGTFQSVVDYATNGPNSLAVTDLNLDGRLDLIIGESGAVGAFIGNGDGTFQTRVDYPSGNGKNTILLADLNGDGIPDVVGYDRNNGGIGVLLGNGDGTLQKRTDYLPGTSVLTAIASDFDGDGKPDLAIAGNGQVVILVGTGNGNFRQVWASGRLPVFADEVAAGDFNGDGKPDLIVQGPAFGNFTASRLVLLSGNGDGTFAQGTTPSTGACQNSSPIAADFDGDGKFDLVLFGNDSCLPNPKVNPRILVLAGNGDGTFQAPIPISISQMGFFGVVTDLDGNGSPDLVAIDNSAANSITLLVNSAGSDFSISASAVNPSTLNPGQSATSTISLKLLNAFNKPVLLNCSVQAAQASAPTCSLSSNSVTFDASGKASETLTINAGSSVSSFNSSELFNKSGSFWFSVAGLAFLGTGVSVSQKKRLLAILLGTALFTGLIMQLACGGGSNGPKSTAYTVTVIGTSGATQHSTRVKLTVQ